MMWWAVWCAAVACCASAVAAPAPPDDLAPLTAMQLAHLDSATNDDGLGYAMSSISGRYASDTNAAPWLYLLEELPRDSQRTSELGERRSRPKRKMPSLSISNPMEVLRQRLMLEVARKQMREASQRQAVANRVFLQNVGKRGDWMVSSLYDN